MIDTIAVNAGPGETRIAGLAGGRLIDLEIHRLGRESLVGNVYRGRVETLLKGSDAALVDIGSGPPGFLARAKWPPGDPLTEGRAVVVRVLRDAVQEAGLGKGPKLTARLAEAGGAGPPALLAAAPEPALAAVRRAGVNLRRIIADDAALAARLRAQGGAGGPEIDYRASADAFAGLDIDDEIAALAGPVVPLASGGRLIFEATAALSTVDVDSGGGASGFSANLHAIPDLARHLRLRNLSGLIVVDFVTMKRRDQRQRVVEALGAALAGDPVPCHVGGFTALGGLLEMTRQRQRPPLAALLSGPEAVACAALRGVLRLTRGAPGAMVGLRLHPAVVSVLGGRLGPALVDLEGRLGYRPEVAADAALAADGIAYDRRN